MKFYSVALAENISDLARMLVFRYQLDYYQCVSMLFGGAVAMFLALRIAIGMPLARRM